MVILRKINSSTIAETMIATVILLFVFSMTLMIVNNLFLTTIRSDTTDVFNKLNYYQYLYANEKLKIPFNQEIPNWDIEITRNNSNEMFYVDFNATNKFSSKQVLKRTVYYE